MRSRYLKGRGFNDHTIDRWKLWDNYSKKTIKISYHNLGGSFLYNRYHYYGNNQNIPRLSPGKLD
ncbi:unnamed protein product [marine sediment metagenome]|uniref:Uncharacterized protein n=1 Tax=marine sediment metagenome TaxID=412755 RepID=X1BY13_9ZZZZ